MATDEMSGWERVHAALQGGPSDRPAWGLWRHFYNEETSAEGLARAMVWWAREYQFDFLKVNPRAQYHVEDWGGRYRYPGGAHEKPVLVEPAVKSPEEWERLRPLDPRRGALGEHLHALRLIRQGLEGRVPFIQTIFLPVMVAGYLVGSDDELLRHVRQHRERVLAGLETIAETFAAYVDACREEGVNGFFFATRLARQGSLTPEEYGELARPFDLRVIQAAGGAEFNVLHVCGEGSYLLDMLDYPVHAFNWAATSPSNPSLSHVAAITPRAIIGGLSHEALTADSPEMARHEILVAKKQMGGSRWLLGPNCSIPTTSRPENLRAALAALAEG